jgi:hypothetical protein
MSANREDIEHESTKKRTNRVEGDPSSPAENRRKEAYDSVDKSEDYT